MSDDIFQPRRLDDRNKARARDINRTLDEGGGCFDGKIKSVHNMDHQHLCNTYWFNKIFNNFDEEDSQFILQKIKERFNGELLPYKPVFEFKQELFDLYRRNLLKNNNGVFEVWFEGKKIGQY